MSNLLFVETNPIDSNINWLIDDSKNVLERLKNLDKNYKKTIDEFIENGKDGEFFLVLGYGLLVKIKDRYFTEKELQTRKDDIIQQKKSDDFVEFLNDILNSDVDSKHTDTIICDDVSDSDNMSKKDKIT